MNGKDEKSTFINDDIAWWIFWMTNPVPILACLVRWN